MAIRQIYYRMKQGLPQVDKHKVVVLSITYNQSRYVEDALNGFSIQQTMFPFLCCVFDDASTDGEQEVLRKWIINHCRQDEVETYDYSLATILKAADKDNRNCIYVIHLQKRNLFGKQERRELIDYWSQLGEYIALCEGDDYWTSPLKLQSQVDFLENNLDFSAIASQSRIVYSCKVSTDFYSQELKDRDYNRYELIGPRRFHTATLLYRNVTFLDKEPPVYSGDACLMFTLSALGRVHYSAEETGIYRKHPSGASSTCTKEQLKRDFLMIAYFKSLYPQFPIRKLKSYLYYSLARGAHDVSFTEKVKYCFESIYYSFSYFPNNLLFVCRLLYGVFIYRPFFEKRKRNLERYS